MKNIFRKTAIIVLCIICIMNITCFAGVSTSYKVYQNRYNTNMEMEIYIDDYNNIYFPIRTLVNAIKLNNDNYDLYYDVSIDSIVYRQYTCQTVLKGGSSTIYRIFDTNNPDLNYSTEINKPILEIDGTSYCYIDDIENVFGQTFYVDNKINAIHFFDGYGKVKQYWSPIVVDGYYRLVDSALATEYFNK